jgi:hypothetical protein
MPTVGMRSAWETLCPSSVGTDSSTTANAPACSSARASASSSFPASPRPCTRRTPPSTLTLCGVRPRCAMTGMPARVRASTWGSARRPPSSFTACAPPSFRCLTAFASAACGPDW